MPHQTEQVIKATAQPGQPSDFHLIVTDGPIMVHKSAEVIEAGTRYEPGKYAGDPRIRGVGTSTMVDTDGDRFMESALRSIVEHSLGLNVILNHVPMVPDNLFGSVLECKMGKRDHGGTTYDVVEVESDVILTNPQAVRTYEAIAGINTRPRQLGLSVGCIYTDVRRRREKAYGRLGVDVYDAYPGEYSVIPMPSNRLSWIEMVTKNLKTKGVLPETAEAGYLDRDVLYTLLNREDFVRSDTDAEGLAVWKSLETVARFLNEELGLVICQPRRIY